MINKLNMFGFSPGIPQCPLPAPGVYEWNRECRVWFHALPLFFTVISGYHFNPSFARIFITKVVPLDIRHFFLLLLFNNIEGSA